jgi:hypothetical protein
MDFCSDCGQTTDPDWVFCRSCGSTLDAPDSSTAAVTTPTGPPRVELISRGWDVVDVEPVEELPADPMHEDIVPDLAPGAIEVAVDSLTVVAHPEAPPADTDSEPDGIETVPEALDTDRWDHLRPHGQIPGVTETTTLPARTSRVAVLVVALGALIAAGIRFFLNTRLEAFGEGSISARALNDVETVADVALLVVAGMAVIAGGILIWWLTRVQGRSRFRPGPAETIALGAGVSGIALIATFMMLEQDSVTAAIAANSLVVLGLGMVMAACLATVRSITRIEFEDRG